MKTGILSGALLAVAILLLALGGPWVARELASPRPGARTARAEQRSVTLEIGGMTCEGCAKSVRTQIAAVPGVEAVDVRLDQKRAYVVCDPEVADTTLVAAVERPGAAYSAAVIAHR